MGEIVLARPENRLAAIRAFREGKLGVSFSTYDNPFFYRDIAKEIGWTLPKFFGAKKVFITKCLESDENFKRVLMRGLDIWLPQEYLTN